MQHVRTSTHMHNNLVLKFTLSDVTNIFVWLVNSQKNDPFDPGMYSKLLDLVSNFNPGTCLLHTYVRITHSSLKDYIVILQEDIMISQLVLGGLEFHWVHLKILQVTPKPLILW